MIRKKEDHGGKPVLDLTGPDGNAYALLAYAKRYAKDLGMMDKWKDVEKEMTSGDYENLVQTFDFILGYTCFFLVIVFSIQIQRMNICVAYKLNN